MQANGEGNENLPIRWEFMLALNADKKEFSNNNFFFGKESSWLKDVIKDEFITREVVVPGDPTTRSVIRKPSIYQSVNTLEKYLKKQVNDKRMDKEQATATFLNVQRIALAALTSDDTNSFEDALQADRKNPDKLLLLFEQVSLISIYADN